MASPRALLVQFAAFGLVGGFVTLVNVVVYWAGAQWLRLDPNLAWCIGFVAAVIVGYGLQSRFVFGTPQGRSGAAAGMRYIAVALVSFAINSMWVWLLTKALHLPNWAPIPPIVFVTPVVTFCLNRYWVFR
jgi:putative flippase GtrA